MSDNRTITFRPGTSITMTGDIGRVNLSGVFSDAADICDVPVDVASTVGATVCAILGGIVIDGMPHHVCAELIASHDRHADRLAGFAIDTDPDIPDATHRVSE